MVFIVVAGYLQPLFGDLASALGLPAVPTPVGALVTLSPLVATAGIFLVLGVLIVAYKGRYLLALRSMWGVKYLALLLVLGIVSAWTYYDSRLHLYVLLNTYWLVLFLPALVATGVKRAARITRVLILTSFWFRLGVFVFQVLSRPLMFEPQTSSLSSSAVDNVFRLGGIAYGANNSSLTLLVLIPFGLASVWRWGRMAWLKPVLLVVLAYVIYRTDTRTSWLGLVFVLVVFFALARLWIYLAASLALSVGAFTLLPYVQAHLVANIAESGGVSSTQNNLGIRLDMWIYAITHALRDLPDWVVGAGWAGPKEPWGVPGAGSWGTLHNLWVAVLVRSGLIGLACWLAFYVSSIAGTVRAYLHSAQGERLWFAAGVASLTGFVFFSAMGNADWPQPTQMIMVIVVNLWCAWAASGSAEMGRAHVR